MEGSSSTIQMVPDMPIPPSYDQIVSRNVIKIFGESVVLLFHAPSARIKRREFDNKQGPLGVAIGGLNRPVVIRHDSMNNRQPESGSRRFREKDGTNIFPDLLGECPTLRRPP